MVCGFTIALGFLVKKLEYLERNRLLINEEIKFMGIIIWIIFGGLVGWVASLIMRTNREQGILFDIVIGIIGAVIGGIVMSFLGKSTITGFNLYSFLVALLGAVILIAIVRPLRRRDIPPSAK